jgi:hypothetical protein
VLSRVRLLSVVVGLLLVGFQATVFCLVPRFWLLAGAATLAAHFAVPPHWDSARLLLRVVVVLTFAASGLSLLPQTLRYVVLSIFTLFHFSGIFLATTWPEPTPWFTMQVGTRVQLPYIQFMYLKNAYHFYSPEPGPASHLFCLIRYDSIDPSTQRPEADWVTLPNRKFHWKDPLGLTYYRRLSITEQVANAMPLLQNEERKEIDARRQQVAQGGYANIPRIPLDPNEVLSFRMPRPDTTRYLVPSYAAHLLKSYSTASKKAVSVKMYRLEHTQLTAAQFVLNRVNPHHPTGFKPFYLGEFKLDADGTAELVDQQDPMLYWHVPILPRPVPRGAPPGTLDYDDYMSQHAGYTYTWEARTP